MQPAYLVRRQIRPGRIVGIGKIDQPRFRRYARQHCVDIHTKVLFRRRHGHAAVGQCREAIDKKGIFGEQHFVAGTQIGVRQQGEEFVGAVAANDARRIQAIGFANRFSQNLRRAFGIDRDRFNGILVGLERIGACTQRRLVGGQLDRIGNAGNARASAHIGRNVEHAGFRRQYHPVFSL